MEFLKTEKRNKLPVLNYFLKGIRGCSKEQCKIMLQILT